MGQSRSPSTQQASFTDTGTASAAIAICQAIAQNQTTGKWAVAGAGTATAIATSEATADGEPVEYCFLGKAIAVAGDAIDLTSAVLWLKSEATTGRLVPATAGDMYVGRITRTIRNGSTIADGDEIEIYVIPGYYPDGAP